MRVTENRIYMHTMTNQETWRHPKHIRRLGDKEEEEICGEYGIPDTKTYFTPQAMLGLVEMGYSGNVKMREE